MILAKSVILQTDKKVFTVNAVLRALAVLVGKSD